MTYGRIKDAITSQCIFLLSHMLFYLWVSMISTFQRFMERFFFAWTSLCITQSYWWVFRHSCMIIEISLTDLKQVPSRMTWLKNEACMISTMSHALACLSKNIYAIVISFMKLMVISWMEFWSKIFIQHTWKIRFSPFLDHFIW